MGLPKWALPTVENPVQEDDTVHLKLDDASVAPAIPRPLIDDPTDTAAGNSEPNTSGEANEEQPKKKVLGKAFNTNENMP